MLRIISALRRIDFDESWTFANVKRKEIVYLTHSYHRYPSKFIPQLASALIEKYSKKGELVLDPFTGSGTTLLEALLLRRYAIGIDINPISELICKAKTTPIEPVLLQTCIDKLFKRIKAYNNNKEERNTISNSVIQNLDLKRIDFWFSKAIKHELAVILYAINEEENDEVRTFLKCGFSHILKICSKWKARSIKPVRDQHKKTPRPMPIFEQHIYHMLKKNKEYYNILPPLIKKDLHEYVKIYCDDCRNVRRYADNVSLIVTSPPYVTSYQYFYVHQLSTMWLEPTIKFEDYNKKFIGATNKPLLYESIKSETGKSIVAELENRRPSVAKDVKTYFIEMQKALEEFRKVLKPNGKTCIVIGDTSLYGINILNSQVLLELALNVGYEIERVVKRRVPANAKFLPSIRNPKTGSFRSEKENSMVAYPYEFILVLSNSA